MMQSFENSPQILAIKDVLKDFFISAGQGLKDSFVSFYEWLKEVPIPVPPTMLKLFSNNKANLIIFFIFAAYVIFINIRTFTLFGTDKKHAVKKKNRVSEKTLFKHIWIGGAIGAALAMLIFHHKTQHKNFTVTVTVLLFVQLIIFSFVLGFLGFWTFF